MPEVKVERPRVAVLGLGAMGHRMGMNLVKKDFWVQGYDIDQEAMQRFADAGGGITATAQNAVRLTDVSVVLVMVANAEQVTSVLFGPTGAIHGLQRDAVIIISTSVRHDYYDNLTLRIRDEFRRRDVHVLDCPVSGGVEAAEAGTLSICCAGSAAGQYMARPVLEVVGKKIYTIPGGLGSGSKANLAQLVLPVIDVALCGEAMAFAAKAGLNTRDVLREVQSGDGASWIVGDRVGYAVGGGEEVRSAIANSYQDSQSTDCYKWNILEYAAEIDITDLTLVRAAFQEYRQAVDSGWESTDDSALWKLYLHDGGEDAMYQQSFHPLPIPRIHGIEIQDVVDIFIGVHLAASIDATVFLPCVFLPREFLLEIIDDGISSNAQFTKVEVWMRQWTPYLRDVEGNREVCERLQKAVAKANSIGCPLPVASAALQALLIDIGLPDRPMDDDGIYM